jgi:hypothetical protein
VARAVAAHRDWIVGEVLAVALDLGAATTWRREVEGEALGVALERVAG